MAPTSTASAFYVGLSRIQTTAGGANSPNYSVATPAPTGGQSTGGGGWHDPYTGQLGRAPLYGSREELTGSLCASKAVQAHDWYNRHNRKPSTKKRHR